MGHPSTALTHWIPYQNGSKMDVVEICWISMSQMSCGLPFRDMTWAIVGLANFQASLKTPEIGEKELSNRRRLGFLRCSRVATGRWMSLPVWVDDGIEKVRQCTMAQ